jgi:enamine deaminase RidA (YjgF/YER057c/UK114 family)
MRPEQRLKTLGIELPAPAAPGFDYVPLTVHNDTLYLSGQIAKVDGEIRTRGRVGDDISVQQAKDEMRICALQGLAWLRDELGSLDRVSRVLRMNYYICCVDGFSQMSDIADVSSGLFVEIFGEAGRHARSVLGMVALPRNVPCMFDATFAISPSNN